MPLAGNGGQHAGARLMARTIATLLAGLAVISSVGVAQDALPAAFGRPRRDSRSRGARRPDPAGSTGGRIDTIAFNSCRSGRHRVGFDRLDVEGGGDERAGDGFLGIVEDREGRKSRIDGLFQPVSWIRSSPHSPAVTPALSRGPFTDAANRASRQWTPAQGRGDNHFMKWRSRIVVWFPGD